MVHRDVKPANLMLDDKGRVHVADFGVASATGLATFTEAGSVVGTAGYLAPEQARGEPATPASDRYALAVVAFELLTGARPFARESTTAEAMAHVREPIPTASSLNPDLPVEVDDVLERGLAKDPARRFAVAVDLVAALREALDAAAGRTEVLPAVAAPTATTHTAVTRRTGASPATRRRRSGGFPVLLVVLGTLLLAGILAAVLLAGGDDDNPSLGQSSLGQSSLGQSQAVETITLPGTTVRETVTTAPPPEPTVAPPQPTATPTPEPEPEPAPAGTPEELNDEGFRLMQAGNYEAALPLLEQAVAGLEGSGSLTEAYADYNLAYTRYTLGRCDGVLELLERSKQVQGYRKEIEKLKKDAQRQCK